MTTPPPPPPPYGQDPYQQPPPGQDPYQQPAAYPPPQPPTYQVSGPPRYPVSGGPQYPVSGGPQPPYSPYPTGYQAPPPGGYGFDPVTGQPYSDKSKMAAGLLQLLPGFFFALGGIGRLYAGNTSLGVIQLVVTVLGWVSFWCGLFLFFVPWIILFGAWLWFVVDGIIVLAGRPTDGQGRLLRP